MATCHARRTCRARFRRSRTSRRDSIRFVTPCIAFAAPFSALRKPAAPKPNSSRSPRISITFAPRLRSDPTSRPDSRFSPQGEVTAHGRTKMPRKAPSGRSAGRLGGDEFLILLPDTGREGARSVAAKLLEAIAEPFQLGGKAVCASASIGANFLPGTARDTDELVREADEAPCESKRGDETGTPRPVPGTSPALLRPKEPSAARPRIPPRPSCRPRTSWWQCPTSPNSRDRPSRRP